jgi:hypothetical protein
MFTFHVSTTVDGAMQCVKHQHKEEWFILVVDQHIGLISIIQE